MSNTCFTTIKCPALGPINYCCGRVCGSPKGPLFVIGIFTYDYKSSCQACLYYLHSLQDTDKEAWTEMFENPPELLTEVCHRTNCHIYIYRH